MYRLLLGLVVGIFGTMWGLNKLDKMSQEAAHKERMRTDWRYRWKVRWEQFMNKPKIFFSLAKRTLSQHPIISGVISSIIGGLIVAKVIN